VTAQLVPGGLLWLVAHEFRVTWRAKAGGGLLQRLVPILLLLIVPAFAGPWFAYSLRGFIADEAVVGMVALSTGALLLMYVSTATPLVLRGFNERADLDLLLAAPIPPQRVLAAKAVAIYASAALPTLVLLAPFLLAAGIFGHVRWLAALPVMLALSVIATSLAFALVRLLFAGVAPRRARIILQIGGGLMGAAVFLVGQAYAAVPAFSAAVARLAAHPPAPPLDWPARAALGDPLDLAAILLVAALSSMSAARLAVGALSAADVPSAPRARAITRRVRFHAGTLRCVIVKELRCIARDPELLSQLTLQLVYILPIAVLIFSGVGSATAVGPRGAAALTLFAGLLASNLAWLILCGEDAPDLLAAAPAEPRRVAFAKLVAACLPPMAGVVLLGSALALRYPYPALVAFGTALGAALSAAMLQGRFGKPQPRRAFRRRQRGSLLLAIGEFAVISTWSGLAVGVARYGGIAGVVLAVLLGGVIAVVVHAHHVPDATDPVQRGAVAA